MKIYNEIVYQVAGDKLIRVSEDSFEYCGEITECKSSAEDVVEDVVNLDVDAGLDATSGALGDTGEIITEGAADLGQPNLQQFGNLQNSSFGDFTDGMAHLGQMANQNIGGLFNYLGEKAQELSDFIHNPADATAVSVDPDESAYSGLTANKKQAELAANKAKAQARSSLRITA